MLVVSLLFVASLKIISVDPTYHRKMIITYLPRRQHPEIICHLPEDPGPCRKIFFKWRYDSRRKNCYTFKYGGCHGNENNFPSYELCKRKCRGVGIVPNCNEQPGGFTNVAIKNGDVQPSLNIDFVGENGSEQPETTTDYVVENGSEQPEVNTDDVVENGSEQPEVNTDDVVENGTEQPEVNTEDAVVNGRKKRSRGLIRFMLKLVPRSQKSVEVH
ncbi:hypothetical protein Zmor_019421 [Zophobas morio]|uniref:BPTI/Kunitz inhibitor domain-containing protein n=1 Tax=Zophobas morio TaxID=2755281 RepID=A0AA38I1T9_9CUCU|nr:hypothetical protein Zmor_019421 [Zophobas morio]